MSKVTLEQLGLGTDDLAAIGKLSESGMTPDQIADAVNKAHELVGQDLVTQDEIVPDGLTSTQAKDAIYKAHSISSNASKIDDNIVRVDNLLLKKNYFNPSLILENKIYQDSSGILTAKNAGWGNSAVSGLQEVEASTLYAFSTGNNLYAIHEFDSNGIWIKKNGPVATLTTTSNTKYLGVVWLNTGAIITDFMSMITSAFMINKGTLEPSYVSYDFRAINDTIVNASTTVKDLVSNKIPLDSVSDNLFDLSKVSLGFLQSSTGAFTTSTTAACSDYIAVKPSTKYYLSGRTVTVTTCIVCYDSNKNILPPLLASYEMGVSNVGITTPATAAYVRFTCKFNNIGSLDSIQFELGETPTAYKPYFIRKLIPSIYIPNASNVTNDGITRKITIKNSDKITVFGNSYTEGYTMLKKHYLDILSMFSDYQFRNYGKSGDDLLEILARVRSNNTAFGTVPISEFGTTYGVIACRDNNGETYGLNIDTYYENAKKLAIAIETLGAIPILSTEHQKFNYLFNSFERLSREKGYLFMNWSTFANKSFNNNYFQPLWHNNHPATRTTWLWANGMKKYIDSLPRPKQGIKLFRVRNSIDTTSLSNMVYETINDRAKIYEEFIIGSIVLSSATDKYFDRLQESTSYSQVASEYLSLQMKNNISLGGFMLGEFILPISVNDLISVKVNVTMTNLTNVYIKKTLGLTTYLSSVGTDTTYLSKFKEPVGEWVELPIVNGLIEIPSIYFKNSISFDKFSLLFKGSLLTISDVYVDCTGYKEKNTIQKPLLLAKYGTELLTSTLLDDGTNWTSINSYSKVIQQIGYDGSVESFPSGINTVRSLVTGEVLSQSLATTNDEYSDQRVQVKILCRYFPEYVGTDALYATSVIKRGSFDCAKLEVGIETSGVNVKLGEELIGLYWQEVIVEGLLDYRGGTLKLKAIDKTIQIAKVSVVKI